MAQTVVVIGANHWGSAAELPAAKRRFTAAGGRLSGGYAVLTFPAGTEFLGLDEIGRYHYRGTGPHIEQVPARTPSRKS